MSNKFKRALVIVNPKAGRLSVRNGIFDILNQLCSDGITPTVMVTQARGDAKYISLNRSDSFDVVIACGGDGTLNETICGMMESGTTTPIGYIPCGSTNDMANTLGIPRSMKKAAALINDGDCREHDIGKFGGDRYFTYIASFGAFTKASYTTPQSAKNTFGHLAYLIEGAKEIGEIKPYHVRLHFNGMTIEDDFLFASVSNSTSAGGVLKFPPSKVRLNDGMFELLLIRNPANAFELSNLIIDLSTSNFKNKNILLYHTNRVCVMSNKSISWTVDGESGGDYEKIIIDNIPDTIRIIQPKNTITRRVASYIKSK